jgi:hypothetical protein
MHSGIQIKCWIIQGTEISRRHHHIIGIVIFAVRISAKLEHVLVSSHGNARRYPPEVRNQYSGGINMLLLLCLLLHDESIHMWSRAD